MTSRGPKRLPESLKSWICPPLVVQHIKHEIANRGNVETTQKRPTEIPSTECQQNHFLAMGKMKNIAKASMENAEELQKRGEDNNVNAQENGQHFWVLTRPKR